MTGALAVRDDVPDLLGTAPSDLIDPTTEQPPADLTTARQRAERIRADLVSYTRMRQDIADAYACRDWAALGYSSWYGYLEGEFGPELQKLARRRGERQEAVRDLRGQKLSTRQIAKVTGVDAKTVRNDLDELPAPPTQTVTGADGKTYPAKQDREAAELETAAAFPVGRRVEWTEGGTVRAGEIRTIYPGGRALWVIDDSGFGHSVGPRSARLLDPETHLARRASQPATSTPAAAAVGDESPAGPVAPANDPRADAAQEPVRPGAHPDSPASRDPQKPSSDSGEAVPAAVATPGWSGVTAHPVRELGAVNVGGHTRLTVRVGQTDPADVPHCWLTVEDTASGVAVETLALSVLKVELLLGWLSTAHADMRAALHPVAKEIETS